jgi:Flp pilus assembly protein TadD, contains TPR repeats
MVMKIIIFTFFGFILYFVLDLIAKRLKLRTIRKWIAPAVAVFTVCLFVTGAILASLKPDGQCTFPHTTSLTPPQTLNSANDYFLMGDYEYEKGNCEEAIRNYDKAIELNPDYAEAYNNRAYTHMRMRLYELALPDLDRAIELRPDYTHALMNRGDIYNYYYKIDKQKAVANYNKVIALGGFEKEGSICGHKLLAYNNGWSLSTFWQLLTKGTQAGCI